MTLFTVSNKTWLNVEGTLNSWNRAKCSIASARGMTRGSTQLNGTLENDWHVRGSHTQTSRGTRRIAKGPANSPLARGNHGDIVIVSDRTLSCGRLVCV